MITNAEITMKKAVFYALLPIVLFACSEQAVVKEAPIKAVKTLTITHSNLSSVREISGTVVSSNTTDVSFRVSGLVKSLQFSTGDKVIKGQLLAQLEQKEFELAVNSAKAELASARANFSEKQEELNRQSLLKEKGFVAQSAVDQAQAVFNSAQSQVEVAQANLETAQNNLSYTVLKSPVSGVVSSRSVDPFAEISAGQSIYELQSANELEVDVLMPETLIGEVNYGDIVNVTFPSIKDMSAQATVITVASTSDTAGGFPVTVKLLSAPEQLRSGMTARVTFNLGEALDTTVYLLPLTALDTRIHEHSPTKAKNQASVFVVNNNKAEHRLVTIRDVRDNQVEVVDGLSEGDQVIVAGVSFITNEQPVTVWAPNYNLPAKINQ